MSNHTPGPWSVYDTEPDADYGMCGVYANSSDIARCSVDVDRCKAEVLANANLIAAAPDMLAVLKKIEHTHLDDLVFEIRAVIAKAEGK